MFLWSYEHVLTYINSDYGKYESELAMTVVSSKSFARI